MRFFAFLLALIFIQTPLAAEPLVSTLAQVRTHVITTRELRVHQIVEKALGIRQEEVGELTPLDRLIREWLLYLEAKSFYNAPIGADLVAESQKTLEQKLKGNQELKLWGVQITELREKVIRRLEAERLYQFKKKASVLPVTLAELEAEYTQNRSRYGESSFNDVKEDIRRRKSEENLRERLRQWFAVLAEKYKVQSFLTPSSQDPQ